MSKYALTGTGDNLRRVVARAVGTFALGAAGLALGVTLATPAAAAERGPLGSVVGDTLEATVRTVTTTTDLLGLTRTDRAGAGDQATTPVPEQGAVPEPVAVPDQVAVPDRPPNLRRPRRRSLR